MISVLQRATIFFWMMFNPVTLFQRINELDWYQKTLRTWVNELKPTANSNILDLGCATGALTEYLASCGYNTTGIDASRKMIKAALANKNHLAGYQIADANAIPFEDSSFDVVLSASLLNIVGEPEKLIMEMTRVCKQGGLVSILVPKQGISDAQIAELINSICATSFSAAALYTWHKRAPKLHPDAMAVWFNQAGMKTIHKRDYLGGMVTTMCGVKPAFGAN